MKSSLRVLSRTLVILIGLLSAHTIHSEQAKSQVSDNINGALYLKEAFRILQDISNKYQKELEYLPYEGGLNWEDASPEQKRKIRDLIFDDPEFVKLFQLLEKATEKECCFENETFESMLEIFGSLRRSARILCAKSKIESENSKFEEALKTSFIALKLGRCLSNEKTIISQLVRFATDTLAVFQLNQIPDKETISPDLYKNIIRYMEKERQASIVSEKILQEAIAFTLPELCKQIQLTENAKECLKKIEITDTEKEQLKRIFGTENFEIIEKIVKDYWTEEISTYLKMTSQMIKFTSMPYWKVKENISQTEMELKSLSEKSAIISKQFFDLYYLAYKAETRLDALLGAAEIGLAIRIYRRNYSRYPESLNHLTPEILVELPQDPFSGEKYRYKKGPGIIVYSIGENLKDDGGKSDKKSKLDIVWKDR
ncbi:MAG: hypothetical protein NC906_04155 [Candidatus Omnitrophica bacterium]|nr:hypothetical protein [Candidatus Omnitrophota bacterium]